MQINIIEIYQDKTIVSGKYGDKETYAYWIKFKWNLITGHAYFHPYGHNSYGFNDFERMELSNIYVETSQDKICNVKKLCRNVEHIKINELFQNGNYHVLGKVGSIVKDDDGCKLLFDIIVDDCRFDLSIDEVDGIDLELGDFVEFDLIGLSLYDEGY